MMLPAGGLGSSARRAIIVAGTADFHSRPRRRAQAACPVRGP